MREAPFYIVSSSNINPQELCELTAANEEQWQAYFPQTVAHTITLEASTLFLIELQADEVSKFQFLYGLRAVSDDKLKGIIYLKELDWEHKKGEFAYAIDASVARQGWVTKAITILSRKAFETLGLERLEIFAHRSNIASMRVAEKCNFVWKKTALGAYTPSGSEALDMEVYVLTKSEL